MRLARSIVAAAAIFLLPHAGAAQSNDECTSATIIKRVPFVRTLAVEAATPGATDPDPSCDSPGSNVWFAYTARSDVSLELDTTDSGYRAAVSVYTGDCAALTEIACAPDNGPGHLIVPLRKGQSVRIAVGTEGSAADKPLSLIARKSKPRYLGSAATTEILRSSDASPYGGSQGYLLAAVAASEKTTVFAQDTEGVFADVGGGLATIAHSGAPTPLGGTFATFHAPVVSATDVYFRAEIDGGPVAEAIFKWNGTELAPYLSPGDAGPTGTTLARFIGHLAVSTAGTLAFIARTAGDADSKLMLYDGSTVTLLATEGDATACGPLAGFATDLAIDDAGTTVAFVDADGVFTTTGSGITAIACHDAPTPLGGTYRGFGRRPAINDLGEVYFASGLDDQPTGIREAIWMSAAGVTTAVATQQMMLTSGETVRRLPVHQQLATNAAGDVVFVASLLDGGRALVRRAHLAPLPSTHLLPSDACPLGGTFGSFDDEIGLSADGDVVFDSACTGRQGVFRKPLAATATTVASVASVTAIGSGVSAAQLAINDAGNRIAFRGLRVTLQALACGKATCAAPVGLVDPATPLANVPGQVAGVLLPRTLGGTDETFGFVATTRGLATRSALLRFEKGTLDAVASAGDVLPGGTGTFTDFTTGNGTGPVSDASATVGVGRGIVAFRAAIDHPTASVGLFAATSKGLGTIALAGDPAPRGEAFEDFSDPVVGGRSVVFLAETTAADTCVFATPAVGRAIEAIACDGDGAPAAVGGTITEFLAAPAGSASDLYVPVRINQGQSSECLLRFKNGVPSVVRCQDDIYIGGAFYDSFDPFQISPRTDAKAQAVVFEATAYGGVADYQEIILSFRRDTFVPLLTAGVTEAPLSGGLIETPSSLALASGGKSAVLSAEIFGGTAHFALFRLRLP